ncbi:hypothetical protein A1O1_05065 [Capronia coronata CBS 617.96]|uniref:Uncharacterized protein n=1 Tax=Capronia coronata CBS 617.96 TaxID=1182541 RepID=W9Y5N0_9EURO|nr:uncharacterized protein A1O1_05065 [Capronia coronata CBS 617.96]EXJ88137.1 hypothetical protein A1O1_05065 [Capronia coronata CBS 617.96]
MDSEEQLVDSPITNEGQQSENASVDSATAIASSPLPPRPGLHHSPSTARKRNNEEVYGSTRSPRSMPTPSRFQKSTMTVSQPNEDAEQAINITQGQESSSKQNTKPAQPSTTNSTRPERLTIDRQELAKPPSSRDSFVRDVDEYQQQLELEFQEFERSLNERNPTEGLEDLDWDDLEARYDKEIQPKITAEQEIMDEFSARFEVAFPTH